MKRFAACLAIALALATCRAPDAGAQPAGHGSLGLPQAVRPLHARVALSDAAAVATVEAVDTGRIRLRDAAPVFGDVSATFALKRSPSRPPPLGPGDRVLLLLRGARSPYVAVDAPAETRVLADARAEERWREAVGDVRAAGADAEALRELYLRWLDGAAPDLQRAALTGLGDRAAPFQPLSDPLLRRIARAAVAAAADGDTRRTAAAALVQSERGREILLESLPGASGADAEVLALALRLGVLGGHAGVRATFERALAHDDGAIRAVALGFGGLAAHDPGLRGQIERLAREDPDPHVRSAAERVLARLARERAP